MNDILATRRAYGDVFATSFEDGTIVPWKLLSIEDYIHYDMLLQADLYPIAFIEDEIFSKCVQDTILVKNIDALKAGTVSVVVQSILQYSGPSSPEDIQQLLNIKRYEVNNILHDMVVWICQAFPGYKPEDLYVLSYHDLMLRFAQAELKLLRAGVIKEPFTYFNQNEEQQTKPKSKPTVKLDQIPMAPPPVRPPKTNVAEEFDKQQEQTIITKADIISSNMSVDSHMTPGDIGAYLRQQQDITNATASVYPEYLEQMKRGEKVKIPTVEERKAAAEARAEANKKKYEDAQQKHGEYTKTELERLRIEREKERKRRAKQRQR